LAKEKWYLITSIDDYSRKLLFADFFEKETTWSHIQAAESLIMAYGLPVRYYVDSLRVFRFVQGRDSFWQKRILETDDVETQWQKMMSELSIKVTHALSPQAKGKIERPYRWLQDRIVRTCIYENLATIEEAREVLQAEVNRYNNHQVHSTTKEIQDEILLRINYKRQLFPEKGLFSSLCIMQHGRSPPAHDRQPNRYYFLTHISQLKYVSNGQLPNACFTCTTHIELELSQPRKPGLPKRMFAKA
jgi:hypothetical protein